MLKNVKQIHLFKTRKLQVNIFFLLIYSTTNFADMLRFVSKLHK